MAKISQTTLIDDPTLEAYYKLENVADYQGAFPLTNNGGVTFTPAKFSRGANLGAANNSKYLANTSFNPIAGNGAISVSYWVRLLSEISTGTYDLFQHQSTAVSSRKLGLAYQYNGGTRRLLVYNSTAASAITYNIALGTTDFHHIVVTRSGVNQQAALYVDNVLRGSGMVQGADTAGGDGLFVGVSVSIANYSSAIFDDIGVFSKVLSAPEIEEIWTPAKPEGGFLPLFC